jgi:hypothetical protein
VDASCSQNAERHHLGIAALPICLSYLAPLACFFVRVPCGGKNATPYLSNVYVRQATFAIDSLIICCATFVMVQQAISLHSLQNNHHKVVHPLLRRNRIVVYVF